MGMILVLLLSFLAFVVYQTGRLNEMTRRLRENWAEEDRIRAGNSQSMNERSTIDLLLSALGDPEGHPGDKAGPRVGTVLDKVSKELEKTASHDRPEATIRWTLGRAYAALGDFPSAEIHLTRACELFSKELGEGHFDTRQCRCDLARNCAKQGKHEQAERVLHKVLQWGPVIKGEEFNTWFAIWMEFRQHGVLTQMGDVYQAQGKYAAAEAMFEKELQLQPVELPESNDNLLAVLGLSRLQQGKFGEAEKPLRKCLSVREQRHPADWKTFNTKSMLGGSLLGQKKYAEAEPLLLASYEGMKQREAKIPPQGKIRVTETLERLVQLYEEQDKPDEAAKWRKELEAVRRLTRGGKP
jgi:tetratricopeptide (TPR) repeat protein